MRRCLFELLKSDVNLVYSSFQKTNFAARRVALACTRALGVLQDTADGLQGRNVWLAVQTSETVVIVFPSSQEPAWDAGTHSNQDMGGTSLAIEGFLYLVFLLPLSISR